MRTAILMIAALAGAAFATRAQDPSPELEARLAELVEEFAGEVDGLSVVVAIGDDSLLEAAHGYADTAASQLASADSRYRAAALIAPLTSLAAARLAEDGEFSLEDPLTKFFPALEFGGAEVTVAQLLDQTSGVPSYLDWGEVRESDTALDPEAVVAWLAGRSLDADPGSCLAWSPTNTLLAGLIVEKVTGRPLAEHLASTVFGPLGLEETSFVDEGVPVRTAIHAAWEIAGDHAEDAHVPPPFGAQRLCSSAADLVRLVRGLVSREIIGEATWSRMEEPRRLTDGSVPPFGNGVSRTRLADVDGLSLGGGFGGAWMHVAHYPAFDLTVAVAAAGEDARVAELERRLAREVLELPLEGVQDLELEPEELEVYVGDYYLGCTRVQVFSRDEDLWVGISGESEFRLRAQGRHIFVSAEDEEVRLIFDVDGERASSFLYVVRGAESRAQRAAQ